MSDLALAHVNARRAWLDEVRATLALAWPIIATNLLQMALTTTDVIMMGRLGPDALASGVLGANLFFAFDRDWRTRRSTVQTPRLIVNIATGRMKRTDLKKRLKSRVVIRS